MLKRLGRLFQSAVFLTALSGSSGAQTSAVPPAPATDNTLASLPELNQAHLAPVQQLEGLQFVEGSTSQLLLEKDGKRYLIDTQTQTIREVKAEAVEVAQGDSTASADPSPETSQTPTPPVTKTEEKKEEAETYYTEDIVLWNLPTAHHLEKKTLIDRLHAPLYLQ